MNEYKKSTPWWMTAIIILCMLPLLFFPQLISEIPPGGTPKALVWLYPAYVIATGVCAWIVYPQRPVITWILLILLLLSHLGMYVLVNYPIS